jgi:hypothetical protein
MPSAVLPSHHGGELPKCRWDFAPAPARFHSGVAILIGNQNVVSFSTLAKIVDGVLDCAGARGSLPRFLLVRSGVILVGWSGIGKSHIIQALGQKVCVQGYRVLYRTSAELLSDLTALADKTLPTRLRYYRVRIY